MSKEIDSLSELLRLEDRLEREVCILGTAHWNLQTINKGDLVKDALKESEKKLKEVERQIECKNDK